MKNKTIVVEVDENGAVKIDACNFTGPGCEKATKFLEDALGATAEKTRKPEFLKKEDAKVRVSQ